jgi:enterochelin esterase-like enzyme
LDFHNKDNTLNIRTCAISILLAASSVVPIASAQDQPRPAAPAAPSAPSQPPAPAPAAAANTPMVVSPEVSADRRITFRIVAPHAQTVTLRAGDVPQLSTPNSAINFAKDSNGVWEGTVGPVIPGAYRYTFVVDGVPVVDPVNPRSSQSNNNVWSLVLVPGSDVFDVRDVPHGAVAAVEYYSKSLGRSRRMHVYTPPGYETDRQVYPIFYLLHGASDSDDSWTSEGRAGFILDNLIAAGKVKPMVVVMPAGHTGPYLGPGRTPVATSGSTPPNDEFLNDFVNDIMPYAEKHYRVQTDRAHRAIAGLSMGGSQTMNIAFSHLDQFAYIGVFSSGILGRTDPAVWESSHKEMLDDASLKKDLKLVWFSTGAEDRLVPNSRSTVDLLKKHGFDAVFQESPGGHTWINWRNYLTEFAPQLFR